MNKHPPPNGLLSVHPPWQQTPSASERQSQHDFSLSAALCRAPLVLACQSYKSVAVQNDPAVSSAGSLFDGWVALKLVSADFTSSPPQKQKNKQKRLDFLFTAPNRSVFRSIQGRDCEAKLGGETLISLAIARA